MQRRISFRSLVGLLVVTLGVTAASPAGAASGDLDGSFSGDGYAVTLLPGEGGTFTGVALKGSAPTGCGQGPIALIGVRREGGALDPTFSGDGRLRIDPLGTGVSALQSCTYLPDGRLLGVGWIGDDDDARMLVAMFTPRGKPDPRFSGDGFAAFKFPGAPAAFGYGVAVQPDGRIVVVGETFEDAPPGVRDFAIARLTPRGALDRTFSDDGRTTVSFGDGSDGGWRVAIDSQRRIVVAGWARDTINGDYDSAVVVLRPRGKLDAGFGDGGKWIYDLWTDDDDYVNGLDLRHDDRIVLGTSFPGSPRGHAVAQLRPGGGFDSSFGGGDGVVENVTPEMNLRDLEVHQRRIVFAGEWSGAPQFVRLRPKGNLDGTFGTGGVAPIPALSGASVSDLTHDREGRIVASGQLGNYPLLFRIMA